MQTTLDFANPAKSPLSTTGDVSTFTDRLFLAHQLIDEIRKLRAYTNRRGKVKHKFSAKEREITSLPYRGEPYLVNGRVCNAGVSIQKIWELQELLATIQKSESCS